MFDVSEIPRALREFFRGYGDPGVAPTLAKLPNGHTSAVLVREGYTVHQVDGPSQYAARHEFHDLDSFAAWLLREQCGAVTDILFDADRVTADIVRAGVGNDAVSCLLKRHPRFVRWANVLGRPLSQRDIHLLVLSSGEDFDTQVDGATGKVVGHAGQSLAAQLQKFSAKRAKDVTVEVNEHGLTTLSAVNDKTTITGTLPASFYVEVPVLRGVRDDVGSMVVHRLELFLSVDLDDKGAPTFTLRCPSLEIVVEAALTDGANHLRRELGAGWLVGRGTSKRAVVTVASVLPAAA